MSNYVLEELNKGRKNTDEALSSLRVAMAASDGMSAQQEANSIALSQELDVPQKVVQAAPDAAQEEQKLRKIFENAMFARWASKSMSNATFAKEDTEGLLGLFNTIGDASEKLTKDIIPNIGRAIVHGQADVNRAMLGSAQALSENLTGTDSYISRGLKDLQGWVQYARPKEVKAESFLGQLGYDFFRSAPQQIGNIGAAIASPAVALSLMATQITGGTYAELREKDVSPVRSLVSGLSNAAMQTPLEKLGLDKFLGIFKSKSFRDTLIRTGGAALTEGATEFVQKYPEVAATLWGLAETKFKEPADQIAWFGQTLFDADTLSKATEEGAYEGLIGAMWGGLGGSARLLASRGRRQRTQDFADFMREVHEAVENTQTKGLAPDVLEDVLNSSSQVFAQSVYVPADAILSEFENGNDLLTPLGITQGEVAQAIKEGTDIAIPHSRIQARLDTDGINIIADMVRENPDAPNMLETLVELDSAYDQAELESAVEDAHLARQRNDAVKLQERRLIQELTPIAGRDAAHTYASLMVAQARTFESVYGVDAAELLRRRTIRRGEEGQSSVSTYNQGPADSKTDSAEFKNWFGDWVSSPDKASKVVDENGKPRVMYHGSNAHISNDFAFNYDFSGKNGSDNGYGFYFTSDKSSAEGYQKNGGSLAEVYLNIRKPLSKDEKSLSKATVKKLLKRLASLQVEKNADEIADYKDGFLSDYADTYSLSEEEVLNKAAESLAANKTALEQIAELGNVVGDKQLVASAVRDITGYDGVYVKGWGNEGKEGGDIYIAWFPESIKAVENEGSFNPASGQIYHQTDRNGKRASVELSPEQAVITIFKGADLSTVAHESAHIFLDDLLRIVEDNGESVRQRLAESLAGKEDSELAGSIIAELAENGVTIDTSDYSKLTIEQARFAYNVISSRAESYRNNETAEKIRAAKEALKQANKEYNAWFKEAVSMQATSDRAGARALAMELPKTKELLQKVQNAESLVQSLTFQRELEKQDAALFRKYGKRLEEFVRHMEGVEQARRDVATLKDFAGVPLEGELTPEQVEQFHETTAKGFEQYLSEGVSPAPHLNGVFSRMFRWLKNLYKSWKDYVGKFLSDDVRRVFDRMLTTEQERKSDGMFETLSSTEEELMNSLNITEEEREELGNLLEEASAEARRKADAEREKEFNKLYKQAVEEVAQDVIESSPWCYCWGWDAKRKKPFVFHPINRKELEETIGIGEAREFARAHPSLVSKDSSTFEGGDIHAPGEGYDTYIRESYEIITDIVDAVNTYGGPEKAIESAARDYVEKVWQGLDDDGFPGAATDKRTVVYANEQGYETAEMSYAAQDEYGEYLEKVENIINKKADEQGELEYRRKQEKEKEKEIKALNQKIEKLEKKLAGVQELKDSSKEKKAELQKVSKELERTKKKLEKVQNEPVRAEKRDVQSMERSAAGYKELRKLARKELASMPIGSITYGRYQAAVRRALTARNKAIRRGDFKEAVNASQMARYSFALLQEARLIKQEVQKIEKFGKKANNFKQGTLPGIQAEAIRKICYAMGWTTSATPKDGRAETASLRDLVQQSSDDAGMLDVMPMFAEWALNLQNPDVRLQAQGKPLDWKQLTIEEATEISNLLKFLVHSGREQNMANKAGLAAKVADIAGRASDQMADLPTHYEHKRGSIRDSIARGWSSINTLDWLFRKADGFKKVLGKKNTESGVMEDEVYQPLREAENRYQERLRKTQEAVTPHMMHLLKSAINWGKLYGKKAFYLKDEQGNKIDFPDALKVQGEKGWTADMVLAMAMNVGNEGNRERLLYSFRNEDGTGGISYNAMSMLLGDDVASLVFNLDSEQRGNILRQRPKREGLLSADDWKAVQGVWDVLGSQWEATQLAHAKMYGFAPRGVDSTPFTVSIGGQTVKMAGGYYPIKYDRSDVTTRERAEEQDILERAESIAPTPAAKKGHTMARANHTGKPLALTVEPLQRHLVDSARFIELGMPVRIADKITRDANFAREFQRAFGINDYDRIRPNLKSLVVDDVNPTGEMYKWCEKVRQHLTFFALAGNFKVALIQSTAIFPAMGDIGVGNVAKGIIQLCRTRTQGVHDVWAASPYMKRRFGNMDQDMAKKAMDFRPDKKVRIVRGDKVYTWDDIVNYGMLPIAVMDTVASTSIWLGAYNKKLSELHGEAVKWGVHTDDEFHKLAVEYADNIINMSNPDNDKLSSNAFARDKSYQRLFNMFSSATTKFAQRTQYMYQGMKAGKITKAEFARMEAYDIMIPSVSMILLLGLMQGLFDGDDKDKEKLADLAVSTTLGQLAMLVPIFGNVAADTITSLAMGGDSNRRAGLTIPLNTPFELAGKAKTAMFAKRDKGEKLLWSTLDIASFLSRIPAGPVLRRAVKGYGQWQDDEGTPFSIIAPRQGK